MVYLQLIGFNNGSESPKEAACVKCLWSVSCSSHLTAFSWGAVCKGAAGQVSNAGHRLRVLGDSTPQVPFHMKPVR